MRTTTHTSGDSGDPYYSVGTIIRTTGAQWGQLSILQVHSGDNYPYYRCTVGTTTHTSGDIGDQYPYYTKKNNFSCGQGVEPPPPGNGHVRNYKVFIFTPSLIILQVNSGHHYFRLTVGTTTPTTQRGPLPIRHSGDHYPQYRCWCTVGTTYHTTGDQYYTVASTINTTQWGSLPTIKVHSGNHLPYYR